MTAITLFDVISHYGEQASGRAGVEQLAARLVEACLADHDRVDRYETDFTPTDWSIPDRALEVERSIYSLYENWVAEAEEVVSRVRRFAAAGHSVPQLEALEDALGFGLARLKETPEKIARAMEQVRRGEVIPIQELRDELRNRLRR